MSGERAEIAAARPLHDPIDLIADDLGAVIQRESGQRIALGILDFHAEKAGCAG